METAQLFVFILTVWIINGQIMNTTISPTPSPIHGCAYTALPDDRLAKGVAVPLYTCIQSPLYGYSTYYECNANKSQVRNITYTNSISCNAAESPVIERYIDSDDFECDGNRCPAVDYIHRTVMYDNVTCQDGGHTLGVGSYVINRCTHYMNYSAITTCHKNSITYTRYNGTKTCEEIFNINGTVPNNVKVQIQNIGCQYRVNPPIIPNGWISSIRCPGYDYSEDDGLSTETIIIIVTVVVASVIIFILGCILLFFYCKKKQLTRRYTELSN